MKSSVYISSEKIQGISYIKDGKGVSVKDYVEYPLPEGTMVNGKIIDHGGLIDCLTQLRTKKPSVFKNPDLIIDGSSVFMKKIMVPKLSRAKYIQFLKDEFVDTAGNFEELVCDYSTLGKSGGKNSILACAADRVQVGYYISAFKAAGIKLRSVRVGAQAVIRYVTALPALRKTTFVLNVIDGNTLISMIFDNGVNVFMTRTRLYSDNRRQLLADVMDNLSGMIQFNKSEKFDDFAYSYYIGLSDDDVSQMNKVNPYPEIDLRRLDIFSGSKGTGSLGEDVHFVYLNVFLGDNCINLINSCKSVKKAKKSGLNPARLWIPLLVLLVAGLLGFSWHLHQQSVMLDDEIQEIEDYISDESIVNRLIEINEIKDKTDSLRDIEKELNSKFDADADKAQLTSEVLDLIIETQRTTITVLRIAYSESNAYIQVEATSINADAISDYVNELEQSDLVEEVIYPGGWGSAGGVLRFSFEIALATEANSVETQEAETQEEAETEEDIDEDT
jgi:hypothetical protein